VVMSVNCKKLPFCSVGPVRCERGFNEYCSFVNVNQKQWRVSSGHAEQLSASAFIL